jgi:prepilin-type N-terminal cleavage/methylation domain-containing protein
MNSTRRRRFGFSLLELAISMAIAGIVVAAASTVAVNVMRVLKLQGKMSIADQDARRLVDFVVGRMQASGGGAVRPWMGLWLEENCAARAGLPGCSGHDRLTVIDVDTTRNTCTIASVSATSITFVPEADGSCCYDWPSTALPDSLFPNQFTGQSLMLVNGRDRWTMVTPTAPIAGAACSYGLSSVRPLAAWADAQGTVVGVFDGGTAVAAAPRTLYVDDLPSAAAALPVETQPPTHLVEWFDRNRNGVLETNEKSIVFPGLYDFQVSLGYDEPEDGTVVDQGSATDEWRGNAVEVGSFSSSPSSLRMGGVGVVVGVKAVDPGRKSAQVLNGPTVTRSSAVLRRAVGKAMLRNVAVFY